MKTGHWWNLVVSAPHLEQVLVASGLDDLRQEDGEEDPIVAKTILTCPSLTTKMTLQFLMVLSRWAIVMLVLPSWALSSALGRGVRNPAAERPKSCRVLNHVMS